MMTPPTALMADAGPADGFERQVVPLLSGLYRRAQRMTSQHADAEDLVQDTLANAFAGYDSLRPNSNVSAWLHRILVNTHINNYRKAQRRPQQHPAEEISDIELLASAAHSAAGLPSAEEEALKQIGDEQLIAAMHSLPEQFRTTVYYADIQGLNCGEIAALMRTPVGTVVSRVHRGRRQLRRLLAEAARS
jgi:RNA polymerase sigma-70 factor (ECF subfamily)